MRDRLYYNNSAERETCGIVIEDVIENLYEDEDEDVKKLMSLSQSDYERILNEMIDDLLDYSDLWEHFYQTAQYVIEDRLMEIK